MKLLSNRVGTFFTGSEIADAVLALNTAAVRSAALEIIDIPFLADDGAVERVRFAVGRDTDVVVATTSRSAAELLETETVTGLLRRSESIGRAVPIPRGEPDPYADELDRMFYEDFDLR